MSQPSRMSLVTSVVAGCALVASVAAIAPHSPVATTTIVGDVSSDSGRRLSWVVISVDGRTDSAVTDTKGQFVLRDVPRGVVSLRVRGGGYRELLVPSLPIDSDTLHFAAELRLSALGSISVSQMEPMILIRHSVDSLTASVASHATLYLRVSEPLLESIEVVVRPLSGKWYGANAESGMILAVMKSAKQYPFAELR